MRYTKEDYYKAASSLDFEGTGQGTDPESSNIEFGADSNVTGDLFFSNFVDLDYEDGSFAACQLALEKAGITSPVSKRKKPSRRSRLG